MHSHLAHSGPEDEPDLATNTPRDLGIYDQGDDETVTDPVDDGFEESDDDE